MILQKSRKKLKVYTSNKKLIKDITIWFFSIFGFQFLSLNQFLRVQKTYHFQNLVTETYHSLIPRLREFQNAQLILNFHFLQVATFSSPKAQGSVLWSRSQSETPKLHIRFCSENRWFPVFCHNLESPEFSRSAVIIYISRSSKIFFTNYRFDFYHRWLNKKLPTMKRIWKKTLWISSLHQNNENRKFPKMLRIKFHYSIRNHVSPKLQIWDMSLRSHLKTLRFYSSSRRQSLFDFDRCTKTPLVGNIRKCFEFMV